MTYETFKFWLINLAAVASVVGLAIWTHIFVAFLFQAQNAITTGIVAAMFYAVLLINVFMCMIYAKVYSVVEYPPLYLRLFVKMFRARQPTDLF